MPEKEDFFSELNREDSSDEDYIRAQKVFEKFKLKNLGGYHDLHLRSDVILLADVFKNVRSMCLEIYKLHPAKYITASGLAFQAPLKMTKVELDLLTDIGMLLMIEKGIRGGICNVVPRYAKANNKYIRGYDEDKESSYLNYWDVNNSYSSAMSQKLPTFNSECVEDISQFTLMPRIQKKYTNSIETTIFISEKENKKVEKLVTSLQYKNEYVVHIKGLK